MLLGGMNFQFLVLISYLIFQFGICYYIAKRINSEEDFLLAGRSLGAPLITLSLFATWFGAETCIGSSSEVFVNGLSGSRADPFGYSLCLVLAGLLIAPRIWNKNYTTLADVFAVNFGPKTENLATWILSISSLIWAAAQLRAFGQVVSSTTDLSVDFTLAISFFFVISYVLYGGLMGDIITDSIQAVIIFLGLGLLLFFIVKENPNIIEMVGNQSSKRLSITGLNESWLQRLDRWAIPILGSLVAQEVISRLLASKSSSISKKSCYYAAIIYIIVGSIPVILGLIGPQLLDSASLDGEGFIIELSKKYMPVLLLPLFSGALISALLATIDSILIAVSGLFSHNILIPKLKVKSEKKKLLITRASIVGSATIAYVLAYNSDSIYSLLEIASSFGTSGILIITLFGLWFKGSSDSVGFITLVIGLVCTPIYEFVLHLEAPFIFSILTSLLSYFILNLCLQKKFINSTYKV